MLPSTEPSSLKAGRAEHPQPSRQRHRGAGSHSPARRPSCRQASSQLPACPFLLCSRPAPLFPGHSPHVGPVSDLAGHGEQAGQRGTSQRRSRAPYGSTRKAGREAGPCPQLHPAAMGTTLLLPPLTDPGDKPTG